MTHLTIDVVRKELEPLGLSVRKVSGGDYRVAPTCGTPDEREMKAQYVDTLESALRVGHQFAELRDVAQPASLPCGITVEDARALSTDPANTPTRPQSDADQEYQLRRVSDGVMGMLIYPNRLAAEKAMFDYLNDFGMNCQIIPRAPKDFEETPKEALVEFARKIARLCASMENLDEDGNVALLDAEALEGEHQTLEMLIWEARKLASMRKR